MATDPVQTMMDMARVRPDPKAVSQWLAAYLGKRPLDMKQELLASFEKTIAAKFSAPADQRAATLVVKTIQKVRETLRERGVGKI
ncbi:MAG: hypothetical protein SFV19_17710 [Rhodospirillaceae bacterium]|nr:hypothetical protein [Rhodospirillaceae bacterium]